MWSVAALLLIAWCHWREFFRKRADADSDGKRRMLLKYLRVMIVIAVLFAFLDGADLWQVPNWLLLLTEMAIAVILLWKFFHNRKQ